MTADTYRTLVVDDHAVVRFGYKAYLQELPGFRVVAEAETADEAYSQYKRCQPDIVIMDIMLPGASGIDASRRILASDPSARILIFSMYASPVLVQQALDVGVLGAIGKQCPPDMLREASIAVARGARYLDPGIAQSLAFSRFKPGENTFSSLSQREFEIFLLLVSGTSNEAIAQALSLSDKTVANRLSIIRHKLRAPSDIQLVKIAAAAGLVPWMRPDFAGSCV